MVQTMENITHEKSPTMLQRNSGLCNRTNSVFSTSTGFSLFTRTYFFLFLKRMYGDGKIWKEGLCKGLVRYYYAPLGSQKRSLGMLWLVGRRGKQQLVGKLCFGRVLDGYSQSTVRVQSLSENAHPPFLLCLQSYGHSQTHSQHPKTISTSNQCIITTQNTEFSNLFGQNNTEMH